MAGVMYCCKKWKDGKLERYQTSRKCSDWGAVLCADPDPPKPENGNGGGGGGGGGGEVIFVDPSEQCPEGYKDDGLTSGTTPEPGCIRNCSQKYRDCIDRIRGEGGDPTVCREERDACIDDCKGTGTERRRCVKLDDDDDDDDDDDGDGCEGGSKLSEGYAATESEQGKLWKDPEGILPDRFFRYHKLQGHMVWDKETKKYYLSNKLHEHYEDGAAFPTGYDHACKKNETMKDIDGVMYCCPGGGGGGNGGGSGEWNWGPGIKEALRKLLERFNFLMENPRGTTEEERQSIINYALQGVKRGERGRQQSSTDMLSRMGLQGSGLELSESNRIQRGTREMASGIRQGTAVDELDRRFRELMGGTGMAQSLLGTLMGSEQLQEVINSGRRGEGRESQRDLFNYLQTLLANQGSGGNYWNAILSQMQGGNQGSGGFSWLPWLGQLFGNYFDNKSATKKENVGQWV